MARRLKRREFLTESAKAGLGLFAIAQIGGTTLGLAQQASAGGTERLTMFAFSGLNLPTVANEVAKFYMQNHPGTSLEVLEGQNFEVYPKMVAARKLTPDRPLVHFGYSNTPFAYQGDVDDMWETLDLNNIPNAVNMLDAYRRPGNKGIGFSTAPVGLMYNPNFVREAPTSWTDLWNPRFRGKVTSIKYAWYLNGLVIAARLNGGNEKNIDAGFKLWSERANQYVAFANSNVDTRDLIVRGDAWLAVMFGGNVLAWKRDGAPLEFVIPREGLIAFPLYMVVVKGVTPQQKRIAEEVVNLVLSERWLARWAVLTNFVPTSKKVVVPPSLRDQPMYSPKETERAIQLDWATMAQNETVWRERWDKEVVARIGR